MIWFHTRQRFCLATEDTARSKVATKLVLIGIEIAIGIEFSVITFR
jgi:hypothetical protein